MTIADKTLKKSFPLGIFSVTFLVALTSQPSSAFTVNDPNGEGQKYVPSVPYTLGGNTNWRVDLEPKNVTAINKAGKEEFTKFLNDSIFGKTVKNGGLGWTFTSAPNELAGSFDILNYVACAPKTPCQSNQGPNRPDKGGVGAFIDIQYIPGKDDPKLGFKPDTLDGIHWIQRARTNHKPGEKHGVKGDLIDVVPEQTNPYYDQEGTADMNLGLFADVPYARDSGAEHKVSFDLFLVEQTEPKKVTIHSGVKWGWKNVCLPENKPKGLSLFAEADASGPCQDFGDAPDSYKTLLASDGPRYQEGELQLLGQLWDTERDGQPTPLADGDDINGGCKDYCHFVPDDEDGVIDPDDEDGVIFGDSWVDVTFNISRRDPNPYQLRAWWDTNYNGVFDHTSELYIDDILTLSPDILTLSPGNITKRYDLGFNPKADGLYSRFRLTWDPLDSDVKPFGEYYSEADCTIADAAAENCTSHGEVEDYVQVPEPSSILGFLALGTLRAASTLKRKLKPSQSKEK